MIMTIYNFNDNSVEVKIPVNTVDDIEVINIILVSGDEVGEIILKNGDTIHFDASGLGVNRIIHSYDSHYSVRGSEKIKQWLEFKPSCMRTASYERQGVFLNEKRK